MNRSLIFRSLLTALLVCTGASLASAQMQPGPGQQPQPGQQPGPQPGEEDEEDEDDEEEQPPATDPETLPGQQDPDQQPDEDVDRQDEADQEPIEGPGEAPEEPTEEDRDEQGDDGEEDGPISDMAEDDDFVPVEDLEEDELETVTPADVYPYVDWEGYFRFRSELGFNLDLDTGGTSAVPPPAGAFTTASEQQVDTYADEDAQSRWSSNMRFRLAPTINIHESIRLHVEADLLDNVVLGSQRSDPQFAGVVTGPDEGNAPIRINEAWGEFDTYLGTFRAGRMDDDWGLGLFADDGDCTDCDVENPIDRVSFTTEAFDTHARLTADFPSAGAISDPLLFGDQAYNVGGLDDTTQFTFSVFRKPMDRQDREERAHLLREDDQIGLDGGLYFTYRDQDGAFDSDAGEDAGELGQLDQGTLVYRGLSMYIPDLWLEATYNPDEDTLARVGLEAVALLGNIDNASGEAPDADADDADGVNCFDEEERQNNQAVCTGDALDIGEFGLALESEFYFGGPVRFGLNGGLATGGSHPNWGFETDQDRIVSPESSALDFYRFHPNYHVDQILFRQVIGTVTNAFYTNPWVQLRFFEDRSKKRRVELQFDAIGSGAMNPEGTPSATLSDTAEDNGNRWLGVELDAAARYLELGSFMFELEGGVLFPLDGLDAQLGGERLVPVGAQGETFNEDVDAELGWTVQSNFVWTF